MAGLDPTDTNPLSPSPIDSINQWPWISGQVTNSPRNVVVLDHLLFLAAANKGQALGAIIVGNYKVLIGPQPFATWYGGPENNYFSPNQSYPYPNRSKFFAKQKYLVSNNIHFVVDDFVGCSYLAPCLYDLSQDPYEHNDLSTQPGSAAIISNIITNYWNPLYNEYHPPLTSPQNLPLYCQSIINNQGFLAPYTRDTRPYNLGYVAPPTVASTAAPSAQTAPPKSSAPSVVTTVLSTAIPTGSVAATPSASPSALKICQYGGFCKTTADCVPGNRCNVQSQYYSQCIPDPTTYR